MWAARFWWFLALSVVRTDLVGVEVVGVLVEWQPTNTGMLDSEVDFIILLGRGVM